MSDINTTPLVDVMLVLLIIFLITIPVVIQTVPVNLPAVRNEVDPDQAGEHLAVGPGDGAGGCEVYWNLTRVNNDELLERAVKKLEDQIKRGRRRREYHRGKYARSAYPRRHRTPRTSASAARCSPCSAPGFARVGFISQPNPLVNQ